MPRKKATKNITSNAKNQRHTVSTTNLEVLKGAGSPSKNKSKVKKPKKVTARTQTKKKKIALNDSLTNAVNEDNNHRTSARKRKYLSTSEDEAEVQTQVKSIKAHKSANVRKQTTKKAKTKEIPEIPMTHPPSPSSKLTRQSYDAAVSPSKGKRVKNPKRRADWDYQRDINVPAKYYTKWRNPTPSEKKYLMNIVDTFISSILSKTSSRRYNMVMEQLNLLKGRLLKTISKESVPNSEEFNWLDLDNILLEFSSLIDRLVDQQEIVNKDVVRIESDLSQLEEQRDNYEAAAAEDRAAVMDLQFPALQWAMDVKDKTDLLSLCVRDDQEEVAKNTSAGYQVENKRLINKIASLYEK